MCIWEQWGTGVVHFDAAEAGVAELGWLVEMSPLVCAAWQCVDDCPGIDVIEAGVTDVQPVDTGVELSLSTGEHHSLDFLIAADGAHSVVRKALGLGVLQQPLDQVAIATVVRTEASHQHTAWQRFLIEGPLAFLPGPDEQLCSVVWSQSGAMAQRRMQLSDDAFAKEIGFAFEYRLGDILAVDRRFSFPLTQQRVKQCAPHPRVLLIGDAMRVVHPLAGQGVNLGLEDVQHLLMVASQHADLAAPGIWQRFARQRQTRSQMMIQVMSALQKIYTNPHPAMSLLRNVGVRSFNALDGLKRQVMREAMGLSQL
jgi:2-octaprenylphenol hydroxylase